MKRTDAFEILAAVVNIRAGADDETALKNVVAFPLWQAGEAYKAGERIRYGGELYKVLTAHTSQEDWKPGEASSLFAKVLIPDPEVIPDWEQPDSTNPYMKGDKVKHGGKVWVSAVDNNVWEPGATGTESLWTEVK